MSNEQSHRITRRMALASGVGAMSLLLLRPAQATPEAMAAAIRDFTKGAEIRKGRVKIDIPPLVENGNTVPVTVTVDSPMTAADHVRTIAIFNEQNPQPNVAIFRLGPRSGTATVSTRMRLATSQKVTVVVGFSDGSFWEDAREVIVTLAACVEG